MFEKLTNLSCITSPVDMIVFLTTSTLSRIPDFIRLPLSRIPVFIRLLPDCKLFLTISFASKTDLEISDAADSIFFFIIF